MDKLNVLVLLAWGEKTDNWYGGGRSGDGKEPLLVSAFHMPCSCLLTHILQVKTLRPEGWALPVRHTECGKQSWGPTRAPIAETPLFQKHPPASLGLLWERRGLHRWVLCPLCDWYVHTGPCPWFNWFCVTIIEILNNFWMRGPGKCAASPRSGLPGWRLCA